MKGFTITLEDRKFEVNFYHAPEKNTTVCILKDLWTEETYRGKARCNTREGDVYNEYDGERISLNRALDKLKKRQCAMIEKFWTNELLEINRIYSNLHNAWNKRAKKNLKKLSESLN